MERVGFQQRTGAFLIDLGLVTLAVHVFVGLDLLLNLNGNWNDFGLISGFGAIAVIAGYGLMEIFSAGTLGKRIMGLTIARDDGQPASRGTLVKRWAIKQSPVFFAALAAVFFVLSEPPYPLGFQRYVRDGMTVFGIIDSSVGGILLFFIIGGCIRVTKPSRQAFHDVIAGTAVYRRVDVNSTRGFTPLFQKDLNPGDQTPPNPRSVDTVQN